MNNALKYKIVVIVLFVLLFVTFITVETFALFETNADADSELEIGQWKIILNNSDISLSQTVNLNNFNYVNNSHIQSGYFAPGSIAYLDIVIDSTRSDVSVEYELSVDTTPIEDYPNISFSFQNMNNNETSSTDTYSGMIGLGDASRVHTVRVFINWTNQTLYDESDISLINALLEFTIDANFKQYVGQ